MDELVDGGPAFPRALSNDYSPEVCNFADEQDGMSLRDWFAGQALISMRTELGGEDHIIAEYAYSLADAMIAAREKR